MIMKRKIYKPFLIIEFSFLLLLQIALVVKIHPPRHRLHLFIIGVFSHPVFLFPRPMDQPWILQTIFMLPIQIIIGFLSLIQTAEQSPLSLPHRLQHSVLPGPLRLMRPKISMQQIFTIIESLNLMQVVELLPFTHLLVV